MLCAAILTPLIRTLAYRFGALDRALCARKTHVRPVPRLGGIAIVIGFYAPLLGLLVFRSDVGDVFFADRTLALGVFMGGIPIAILGVYDDIHGADASKKFVVQFAVAAMMCSLGFRVGEVANPFGDPIQLGWISIPFTIVWIVGVINAMNLIDGLDGLAGGVALVAVSTILLVSFHYDQQLMILFCAALAGSILGFLFYNFNPASIFMGDTGSMFLGFVLATSSIKTGHKSSIAIIVSMVILGLPILDTILAMSRRALRGRPMFHGDKEHIHHRLLALGFSHRRAVLVLWAVSILLGGVALAMTYSESPTLTLVLFAGVIVITSVFLRRLGYIRFEINHYLSDERRRNRALRSAVRPFAAQLRRATTAEEIWDVVRDATPLFEANCVRLQLAVRTAGSATIVFASGFPEGGEPPADGTFRARFPLASVKYDHSLVDLGWRDGRADLDRNIEIAIELFCNHIGAASDRIQASISRSAH
jgi:UDP-GlcNAc:undecaprenyl-phosphate GlcNAc-1-phosphate transferase